MLSGACTLATSAARTTDHYCRRILCAGEQTASCHIPHPSSVSKRLRRSHSPAKHRRENVESYAGWQTHFATLPVSMIRRLVAAVCDGRTGLVALVRERNLLLQRCHFHLIARLQIKRSKRRSSRHYDEGIRLYRLLKTTLTASATVARVACRKLAVAARVAPRGLKTVLSGFIANYEDYRAYRRYPHLGLPTTTGSAESLISSVRELLRQLRGVRTRAALEHWVNAYLKYRRTIRCNSQQN